MSYLVVWLNMFPTEERTLHGRGARTSHESSCGDEGDYRTATLNSSDDATIRRDANCTETNVGGPKGARRKQRPLTMPPRLERPRQRTWEAKRNVCELASKPYYQRHLDAGSERRGSDQWVGTLRGHVGRNLTWSRGSEPYD